MAKKRTGESLKDLFKEEIGPKELKSQSVNTLKSQRAKALRRQDVKESTKKKRKHTIYLSPERSKKLRIYAAEHDMTLSEVIEKLVDKNLERFNSKTS